MSTVMASRLCQLMVALGWLGHPVPQHLARSIALSTADTSAAVAFAATLWCDRAHGSRSRRGGCGVDVGKQAVYLGSGDVQRWWRVARWWGAGRP
jgi:hypothetical protein